MIDFIDLIVLVGASILAFWAPIAIYWIYFRKQIGKTQEGQPEMNLETVLQGFSEHISTVILEGFDLSTVKSEITVDVVSAIKVEIDNVIKDPNVQAAFTEFLQGNLISVIQTQIPAILTEMMPVIVRDMMKGTQGQEGEEGGMDLSNMDPDKAIKLMGVQILGQLANKIAGGVSQGSPTQISSGQNPSRW